MWQRNRILFLWLRELICSGRSFIPAENAIHRNIFASPSHHKEERKASLELEVGNICLSFR